MPETARQQPILDDDTPSLGIPAIGAAPTAASAPGAARASSGAARLASGHRWSWVTLLVLAFFAAFVILAAWHEVGTLFGV